MSSLSASLPAPDAPQMLRLFGPDSAAFAAAEPALRRAWQRLGQPVADEPLWLRQSYLALLAQCIAAALPGAPAVDGGAFDWPATTPEGAALALALAGNVRRLDLTAASEDIFKGLYESLISRDARQGLGEYYTPDWLATRLVRHAVDRPLVQQVFDPACGSGTFLFHAIRHILAAAVDQPPERRAALAVRLVAGMDIHPVAVVIARVTCLLALGPVLDSAATTQAPVVHQGDALRPGPGSADVVLGNPPWLALRHMTPDRRARFKAEAEAAGLYVGGRFATQNDLCALVTVAAARHHLRPGGRLGLVLPLAVLSRGQFAPLRQGAGCIAWEAAWTFDESIRGLFPVPACVLFGRRGAPGPLPPTVLAFTGAGRTATEVPTPRAATFTGGSPYRRLFRQGATLVPRRLCLVGYDSPLEKPPWKHLPAPAATIEADFLRPVLLGESILPYRVFRRFEGVIPVSGATMLDAQGASAQGHARLHDWLSQAEALWQTHGSSGLSLAQRWNYHNGLTAQFPTAPLRVLYTKGGSQPAACVLRDAACVIDHMLYWMVPNSEAEALYLTAILNSEALRVRAAAFQARGQFGARHFDKVVFNLPIPCFEQTNGRHRQLAEIAARAEALAGQMELPPVIKFQQARTRLRCALAEAGLAAAIDDMVAELLTEA